MIILRTNKLYDIVKYDYICNLNVKQQGAVELPPPIVPTCPPQSDALTRLGTRSVYIEYIIYPLGKTQKQHKYVI